MAVCPCEYDDGEQDLKTRRVLVGARYIIRKQFLRLRIVYHNLCGGIDVASRQYEFGCGQSGRFSE